MGIIWLLFSVCIYSSLIIHKDLWMTLNMSRESWPFVSLLSGAFTVQYTVDCRFATYGLYYEEVVASFLRAYIIKICTLSRAFSIYIGIILGFLFMNLSMEILHSLFCIYWASCMFNFSKNSLFPGLSTYHVFCLFFHLFVFPSHQFQPWFLLFHSSYWFVHWCALIFIGLCDAKLRCLFEISYF